MVIDPNNIIGGSGSTGRSRVSGASAQERKPASGAAAKVVEKSGDNVSLSSQAQTLARLESSVASVGDVDSAKVNSVRSAISNGSYKIDADAIAGALLDQDGQF